MALPLWGELQKSLDDPRTIADFIADSIAEHEADPEAHLGEGESLDTHKKNEVLDHPASSVVPDKVSTSDCVISTSFENLSGMSKSSGVNNDFWPGVAIPFLEDGSSSEYLRLSLADFLTNGTVNYDILFDIIFLFSSADNLSTYKFGISNLAMSIFNLGFRLEDGDLYGFAYWSGIEHSTGVLLSSFNDKLVFARCYYDIFLNKILFYINGQLAGKLEPPAPLSIFNQFTFSGLAGGTEDTSLFIKRFEISRST